MRYLEVTSIPSILHEMVFCICIHEIEENINSSPRMFLSFKLGALPKRREIAD